MSKINVDTIDKQSGSTVTVGGPGTNLVLGTSGQSVTLGTGATQSGFGRTGTVDWQTGSIKTSTFTAASGEGYFCNTAGGSFEVDLPAGSAGAIVSVQDYNNTFDSNALTVDPNGTEKINGGDAGASLSLSTEGQGVTFVYIDATVGWRSVQDNDFSTGGSSYIVASGGTETTSGDFKIHTFTSTAPFNVASAGSPTNAVVEYLVVAGGGSGGSEDGQSVAAGGGGAGGFRFASPSIAPLTYPAKPLAGPSTLPVSAQNYSITVGAGGAGNPASPGANSGSSSVFSSITSTGGGGGGFTGGPNPGPRQGLPGGSGGGSSHGTSSPVGGGAGNTPPVSPAQGNNGGGGTPGTYLGGGGGGGTTVGTRGGNQTGPGGDGGGLPTAFGSNGQPCGSYRYYSGGGGGGGSTNRPETGPAGAGGKGGGASGGAGQNPAPAAATANTGGGGGGAGNQFPNPGTPLVGSNGGSGIVVIRYKFQN